MAAPTAEVPATMKAWEYAKYGGRAAGLKLNEKRAVPNPSNGEVLVRIQAASVNPFDYKIQDGVLRIAGVPKAFPAIPGTDIAGKVVKVGAGGNGNFKVGDRVAGMIDFAYGGGFAQYGVLRQGSAAKVPENVSTTDAASLPIAGVTALQGLRAGGIDKFDGSYSGNVLILAGSGGVGHYGVQLAKAAGAHVTATCGARNFEVVKSWGADEVLDYRSPEGQTFKSPSGTKYDVIVDGSSAPSAATWRTLRKNNCLGTSAKMIALTPGPAVFLGMGFQMFSSQKLVPLICKVTDKDLGFLLSLQSEGKLKTGVDSTYSFDKVPDAYAKCVDGHAVGKIVITFE